jgi:hypothetical protein
MTAGSNSCLESGGRIQRQRVIGGIESLSSQSVVTFSAEKVTDVHRTAPVTIQDNAGGQCPVGESSKMPENQQAVHARCHHAIVVGIQPVQDSATDQIPEVRLDLRGRRTLPSSPIASAIRSAPRRPVM